jgi:hypothetical protein
VGHLARLPALKLLNLSGCPLAREAIPSIGKCAQIRTLHLEDASFGKNERAILKEHLPRCMIFVSDDDEESSDDAPWRDPRYFWNHPPRCLQGFKLTKKKPSDLPVQGVCFQLACKCGHACGEVLGYPLSEQAGDGTRFEQGELFAGPLSFRCLKCGEITSIIDTEEDGYNAQSGGSSCAHGAGLAGSYACTNCRGVKWRQVQATVMHGDGARDLWYEDPEIALEEYFDDFFLTGVCANPKCKKTHTLAQFETA